MTKKEKAREEARNELTRYIAPESTILIIIKSVSSSGMCRRMKVLTEDFSDITYWIGQLCGLSVNDQGLRVTGCGMDMTFWLADYITFQMGWDKNENTKSRLRGNGGSCINWKHV